MSVVYFLILVGGLVLIHEFGHFLAAKLLDVKVTRFSIGFGRPVLRIRGGETDYQLALFPLGGYVRILGEDPADEVAPADAPRAFSARPLWQRLVVVLAGPAANLLLPVLIYFTLFAGHTELPAATVGDVLPDTPAARAGIEPGDRVVAIGGEKVRYWTELEQIIEQSADRELRFRIRRGGRELERYIAPVEHVKRWRDGREARRGLVGITREPFLPQLGVLDPRSPAARAGLETGDVVFSVDGTWIGSWTELHRVLDGPARRRNLAYFRSRPVSGLPYVHLLEPGLADLVPETRVTEDGRPQAIHGLARAEMFVDRVDPGTPAERAGLRPGDVIQTLDGEPIANWRELDQELQSRPHHQWTISWLRATEEGGIEAREGRFTQELRESTDEYGRRSKLLVFGAHSDFARGRGEMISIRGRLGYAASRAVERTGETIGVLASGIGAVLRGKAPSHEQLGGPITMFQVASVSGHKGWEAFLLMLALVSVSVGLINLLPVPVLDGGHIVVFAIEAAQRRPLSPRARERVMVCGLAVVGLITVLALRSDVMRYIL